MWSKMQMHTTASNVLLRNKIILDLSFQIAHLKKCFFFFCKPLEDTVFKILYSIDLDDVYIRLNILPDTQLVLRKCWKVGGL